jgi:hypothetical protein
MRAKVIIYDLKTLLKRLAFEDSFSKDSHGGSAEHNINLVPYMIHMLLVLLTEAPDVDVSQQYIENTMKEIKQFKEYKENEALLEEGEEDEEENSDQAQSDFDLMSKTATHRLDSWMFWTIKIGFLATDEIWAEAQPKLFEIGAALAKFNAQFLKAVDKIFVLKEETREKQNEINSKSSINRYANSVKKILIFFNLVKVIRLRFIQNDRKLDVQQFY